MFAKLLKHEWRATRGIIGLLCIIILVSGLTIGAALHVMVRAELRQGADVVPDGFGVAVMSEEPALSDAALVACILLVTAGIIAVAVCVSASCFFVIYRFYKRCFTDEGYLTFTLPVSNHQILLSSILNCIVNVLITVLAAAGAVVIAVAVFLPAVSREIIWADVWVSWADAWQQLTESFWKNADVFALVGFSSVLKAVGELMVLLLSVTIGAMLARKHKLLAAAGVYFGIGMVQSFVFSLLFLDATTAEDVNRLLANPGIMGLVLSVCGYFLMHWLITKKLNLA